MCAINPKFKKFYQLEFYSSHGEQETFNELLAERLCWMEQAFNQSGGIRVHVTEVLTDEEIHYKALLQCDDFRGEDATRQQENEKRIQDERPFDAEDTEEWQRRSEQQGAE